MTTTHPTLPTTMTTPRLRLRAPAMADASRIAMFIGEWDVAKMLSAVPHPYNEADARTWIGLDYPGSRYLIVHANGVIGAIGIETRDKGVAELGYWLAKPFWGRGIMTEAARAVIAASRQAAPREPLACSHFEDNHASRRVIEKLGFVHTGARMMNCVSRKSEVRALTYRLPVVAAHTQRRTGTEFETAGGVL